DTSLPWPGWRAAAAGSTGPAAGIRVGVPYQAWLPRLALALATAAVILAAILGRAARDAQHQLQQDQLRSHEIAAEPTGREATVIGAGVTPGGTATVVMSGREHALVFAAAGLSALPATRRSQL